MSDNEEVRKDLIRQTQPNVLTNFFYKRQCIAIITPYIFMVLFAGITFLDPKVYKMDFMDDSWLINDNIKVVNRDILNVAKWELNRKEAGIDTLKDKLEESQVRFEAGPLNTILLMYQN